jgi:hypothetical protein
MNGMEYFEIVIDRFVLMKICYVKLMKLEHLERLLVVFLMLKLQPAGVIFQGACIQSGAEIALLPYYFTLFSLVTVMDSLIKVTKSLTHAGGFAPLHIIPHTVRPVVLLLCRPDMCLYCAIPHDANVLVEQ